MSNLVKTPIAAVALVAALAAWSPVAVAESEPRFTRTEVEVSVPDVTLINQHGDRVRLLDLVQRDEPVLVDFIFATCTTICPILSAGYSSLQGKLEDSPGAVHLISISIDPEHDGPAELAAYLERYRARPGWDFLTGTRADIDRVMRAFDAFIPDKMSHRPLIFIRTADSTRWVQLHGYAGSRDLLRELGLPGGTS
jgi:protein SCO1/2